MGLVERIQRRRSGHLDDRLVVEWEALNPAVHLEEPVGRASVIEALFDAIDPVFDGQLPPSVYLWGPPGSGKSAILTGVISALAAELSSPGATYTATRGRSAMSGVRFVYVDGRQATSRFKLYHQLLNGLLVEHVPERGIGTADLVEDITAELASCEGVLLAVDHVSMAGSVELAAVQEYLAAFEDASVIAAGRTPPGDLPLPLPSEQVPVPAYTYELADVVSARASKGLARPVDHAQARRVSEWARGNAHDALTALYLAAGAAEAAGANRVEADHLESARAKIPRGGTSLDQLLSLSDTEQSVLHALQAEDPAEPIQIDAMSDRIADRLDLTSGTVKRLLYELSQIGVLEREAISVNERLVGRQPSMVRPNFSPAAFERLLDG